MTAILDDMRRLEAAHARGELSAIDLAAAKADLLDSVPDADDGAYAPEPEPSRTTRATLWPMLLLCVMVVTICAGT